MTKIISFQACISYTHKSLEYNNIIWTNRTYKQELNGVGTKHRSVHRWVLNFFVVLFFQFRLRSHVGRHGCYDYENIDNDTDHYTNDVPHSGTLWETTGSIVITVQPGRINLYNRGGNRSHGIQLICHNPLHEDQGIETNTARLSIYFSNTFS